MVNRQKRFLTTPDARQPLPTHDSINDSSTDDKRLMTNH